MFQPYQVNYLHTLRDMFPRTNEDVLNDVIELVLENSPEDSFEQKIENMINMLTAEGAQGPIPNVSTPHSELFTNLASIYEDVDESYLRRYAEGKPDHFNIEDALDELSLCNLPKKMNDPTRIWEQLKSVLPNADPSYLKKQANKFASLPTTELNVFLQNAIENNNYPSMQEYLENKKHDDEVAKYTENFDIDKFLETIPNPIEKFSDPNRLLILNDNSDQNDEEYALQFLYNQFRFIRRKYIDLLFKWKKKNLVAVCDELENLGNSLITPRPVVNEVDSKNIQLLQVVAYLQHRKLIKRELKSKDEQYLKAKEEARKYGLLETCQCCFDDELIPEECYFCMKGCVFCKSCVQKGVEVGVGKGHIKFPCMDNCNSEFDLQTLQMVLPKRMFERLAQRIASEEIKKAKVDGLETCPFCDFAMILPEHEKIFKCINEECLIESCRQCRHKSHIPLRCNEIEYDEDVRRRTYIENKMTEALTRICYKCKKSFIKSTGCNKMSCVCGAKLCYLCGKPVIDYSHFKNEAMPNDPRCPLFSNDVEVNLQRVLKGAQEAKNELGNVEIKFDPTANIQEYFR
ncbi:E3 ubiquitin-protein ligase RNF216-like isoform X1 [Diorhabda sublineata]|uniref:E3 ubiquitin-protein ligase RNF216-like isoform X1 n=1 Tax=Diorhabda sublineata TaxID=1163346 RepID=UPI0024E0921C|nr:E3 ubiquitin-protein ligase RNF216-like isoform X1 [Diorhabda sublineata]